MEDSASSPRRGRTRTLVLAGLACAVAGLVFPRTFTLFDSIDKWTADLRIAALSPRMPARSDIVVLSITEDTLAQHPYRFPVDRGMLADVLHYLDQAGVRAVGVDILFDQATEPKKDQRLARVAAAFRAPMITGWADAAHGMTPRQIRFLETYLPGATKAAAALLKGDRDGTARWIYPGKHSKDGKFRLAFPAALARAVGVEPPKENLRLIYRRGKNGNVSPFTTFPLHQATILPKQWFKGKIVIIGADLPNEDRHRTPFATILGNHQGSIPGTVIHAFALAQILDGERIADGGFPTEVALALLCAAIGLGVAIMEFGLLAKILVGLVSFAGVWGFGFSLFSLGGIMIPVFTPSMTLLGAVALGNSIIGRRFRVEKELAEASAKARSEFLAMMSHEIRTPMNGVLGVIELLRGSRLDREQQRMVTIVQDSAASLLGIINDVLDFSKIEAGRLDLNPEPIGLRRLVDGVVATFDTAATSKSVTLTHKIDDAIPDWVSADPVRVRQVMVNLMGNAIKFTEGGAVDVTCYRETDDEGLEWLLIGVRDSGIGMSPEGVAKLFKPFTQADSSTTRRFGGTGLGLSISQRLVVSMGGTIVVESVEGEGSTFTMRVPLVECEPPADGQEAALPDLVTKPLVASAALDFDDAEPTTGPLVLVAEDNPTNQWLIRQQLIRLGCRVRVEGDGALALKAFKEQPDEVAIIITDFHMPELDGPGLGRALQELDVKLPPILALTANALPGVVQECKDAGINEVLTKPTELAVLARALKQWIDHDPMAANAAPAGAAPTNGAAAAGDQSNGASNGHADGASNGHADGVTNGHANGNGAASHSGNGNGADQVLDMGLFAELYGDVITDDLREVLGMFVDGGKVLTETINRNVQDGDSAALSKAAHRLAGESLSAGASGLGGLCKDMEQAADAENWERIAELRPRIIETFGTVREAIAAL